MFKTTDSVHRFNCEKIRHNRNLHHQPTLTLAPSKSLTLKHIVETKVNVCVKVSHFSLPALIVIMTLGLVPRVDTTAKRLKSHELKTATIADAMTVYGKDHRENRPRDAVSV